MSERPAAWHICADAEPPRWMGDLAVAAVLVVTSALAGGSKIVFWMTSPDDAMSLKTAAVFGSSERWHIAAVLWWVLTGFEVAALLARRRLPVAAFVVAALAAGWHLADWRLPQTPADLAAPIALYTIAQHARSRRASITVFGTALAGCCMVAVLMQTSLFTYGDAVNLLYRNRLKYFAFDAVQAAHDAATPCLILTAAWFAGDSVRSRRAHIGLLAQRTADLERERDQEVALAAAAERSHLARELHDVVAHGISVMVVQAQAALAVLRRDPMAADAPLRDVVSVGRSSLSEMRQLLGIVRHGGPAAPTARNPQPGIMALPELIERVRKAGTAVDFTVHGELPPLHSVVDLSVYRIVQEALTNTVKHAGPGAKSSVILTAAQGRLTVEARDSSSAPASHRMPTGAEHTGNGLIGLAERVSALGGELDAGPYGDGFQVCVILPLVEVI
jgi:signal transduction histidine kinase